MKPKNYHINRTLFEIFTFQGRTMIGQNILLELVEGDKVQVYVNTASGLFDHKNSHYTQFIGAMLR